MKQTLTVLVVLIMSIAPLATASDSLTITFDRDEGYDAWDRIIETYSAPIALLVLGQHADTLSTITVISNADGVRYDTNHVKRNALMTTERSVTGVTLLAHFGADLTRVNVIPLMNQADTGATYRYITFILSPGRHMLTEPVALNGAREAVREHERQSHPPIHPLRPVRDTCCGYTALWLGGGLNYSPLEKVLPHIQAEWGSERLRLIATVSYSVYRQDKTFAGDELDVSYRSVAGGLAWQTMPHSQFDLVVLWQRSEVYAVDFGRYARKLEGPAIGIRLLLSDYLILTGLWTPSEEQVRGRDEAIWDTGRMYLGLSAFIRLAGGDR